MLDLSWIDDGGHSLYTSYGLAVWGAFVANGLFAVSDFVICIISSPCQHFMLYSSLECAENYSSLLHVVSVCVDKANAIP